jgi:SAM-dependent methyltransferase
MRKLNAYINRDQSVLNKAESLEHLYTFKDFPVFMGCTDDPIDTDIFGDMIWEIDSFGLVQLSKLVPMDVLYMHQHMDATGSTWAAYNIALADFIVKNKRGDILEIGGGSGKLAKLILENDKQIKYTVVEPNPVFEEQDNLKIVRSFFNRSLKVEKSGIETAVLSQVFEHVYDPLDFLNEVYDFLPFGGTFLFGYPNLEYLFSNKFTNAINFEHTMLMTDYYVDYFLKNAGFKILEKINYQNHSHFYAVEKVESLGQSSVDLIPRYDHYKNMFLEYISYHKKMVNDLNETIAKTDSKIYLFGAHIFSQYLFSFGLDVSKIECILDNSPIKQEKRLYGSSLNVKSPKILSDVKNPVIILKAGLYNIEIMDDILKNINSTAKFI